MGPYREGREVDRKNPDLSEMSGIRGEDSMAIYHACVHGEGIDLNVRNIIPGKNGE